MGMGELMLSPTHDQGHARAATSRGHGESACTVVIHDHEAASERTVVAGRAVRLPESDRRREDASLPVWARSRSGRGLARPVFRRPGATALDVCLVTGRAQLSHRRAAVRTAHRRLDASPATAFGDQLSCGGRRVIGAADGQAEGPQPLHAAAVYAPEA